MGYWSKKKKSFKKRFKRQMKKTPQYQYYKYNKRAYNSKFNRKHKIVGMTPDHWISPIDAVPYFNVVNKGRQGYRVVRTGQKVYRRRKKYVRGVKSEYRRRTRVVRRGRKDSSSPKRTKSRPPYYKGRKRYEYYYRNRKRK